MLISEKVKNFGIRVGTVKNRSLREQLKGKEILFSSFIILLLSLIVYSPYIFGDKIFVYFNDIGSDSMLQFLPNYQAMQRHIRESGLPLYSFAHGLGKNIYGTVLDQAFDPVNIFLYAFGELLIYVLPYTQIIKMLLAGIFSCKLLKKLNMSSFTCILIPVLYAFNGDIIVRAGWYHHTGDTFLLVFMFYAFECFMQDNNKKLLPIASLLVVLMRSTYYPYLYGITLFGYGVIRYIFEHRFELKHFLKTMSLSVVLFFLGIGLSCFYYIPCLLYFFSSARTGSIGLDLVSSFFSIHSLESIVTAFYSLFSSYSMGTGFEYRGLMNILEDPTLYCGILTLLLISTAVKNLKGKRKVLFLTLITICILYIVWPFMHQIFNGPTELRYYKTSSFVIPIIFLFISSYGIESLNSKEPGRKSYLAYFIIAAAFIAVTLIDIKNKWGIIKTELILVIIGTMLFYIAIIFLWKSRNRFICSSILLIAACAELTYFSYQVTNEGRDTVTKQMMAEGDYYWDNTSSAAEYLKGIDNSFYRLQTTYKNNFPNASYMHGFNGIDQYDTFLNGYVYSFFNSVDSTILANINRYHVSYSDYDLNSFLSVKYLLDTNDTFNSSDIEMMGYKYLTTIEEIDIYENKYSIPLGVLMNQVISLDDFSELSKQEKMYCLLNAFIPTDNIDTAGFEDYSLSDNPMNMQTVSTEFLDAGGLEFIQFEKNKSYQYEAKSGKPALFFQVVSSEKQGQDNVLEITFSGYSEKIDIGRLYWKSEEDSFAEIKSKLFDIKQGENQYSITINELDSIDQLRLEFGSTESELYKFSDLSVTSYSMEKADQDIMNIIEMQENALEITSFQDHHIKGEIYTDKMQMLMLSIPYDAGWKAYINGEETEVYNINIGFSGILVEAGQSNIELIYSPPGIKTGMLVSGSCLAIYMGIFFVYPVLKKYKARK